MILHSGDLVFVEERTYDRTMTVLKRAGAKIVGFPLQDDGPDMDAIEARFKRGERPLFFYLIPDFQNPSGTVMSASKRAYIAHLAQEYQFWILEDVPYPTRRFSFPIISSLFRLQLLENRIPRSNQQLIKQFGVQNVVQRFTI